MFAPILPRPTIPKRIFALLGTNTAPPISGLSNSKETRLLQRLLDCFQQRAQTGLEIPTEMDS
jgi:hypothetical protein